MDALDEQLIQQTLAGHTNAFSVLVTKYQGRVAAMVAQHVPKADVSDVTQEVFVKAYRSLGSFRQSSEFYTWIYRIARNHISDYVQREKRHAQIHTNVVVLGQTLSKEPMTDPQHLEQTRWQQEMQQKMQEALQLLPEPLRIAFELREHDGCSYQDIAEIMKCPVGTVRSRIFRARESIEQYLRPIVESHYE